MDIYPGDLARLLYQEQLLKREIEKCERELLNGVDQPTVAPTPGLVSRMIRWLRAIPRREQVVAPRPRTI